MSIVPTYFLHVTKSLREIVDNHKSKAPSEAAAVKYLRKSFAVSSESAIFAEKLSVWGNISIRGRS